MSGVIEIGPQPTVTPEVPEVPEVEASTDPDVLYVMKAKKALAAIENHPMSNHETRLLKDALLVIFGPAIAEAEKAIKLKGESAGEGE